MSNIQAIRRRRRPTGSGLATVLTLSFFLQYNPVFAYQFLWSQYWGGASLRTLFAFATILIGAFITLQAPLSAKAERRTASIGVVFVLLALYGSVSGLLWGNSVQYLFADSVAFLEVALWFLLVSRFKPAIAYEVVSKICRLWCLVAIFELFLFLFVYDEVVVAALISGVRVARLVDFMAPIFLIVYSTMSFNISLNQRRVGVFLATLIVVLGFFRSIWAALILTFAIYSLSSLLRGRTLPIALLIGGGGFFLFSIDLLAGIWLGVESPIIGRIVAAIGTADSIGRVSTAADVIAQIMTDTFRFNFGHGFGHQVFYVNDFGDGRGPVRALQPIGALSNYYVVLLGFFGLLPAVAIAFVLFASSFLTGVLSRSSEIRASSLVALFLAFLFLTFPNTLHFPIFMFTALVIRAACDADLSTRGSRSFSTGCSS